MVYTLRFLRFKTQVCFIILTHLVPVLFTFYIQGVLKLKKKFRRQKVKVVWRGRGEGVLDLCGSGWGPVAGTCVRNATANCKSVSWIRLYVIRYPYLELINRYLKNLDAWHSLQSGVWKNKNIKMLLRKYPALQRLLSIAKARTHAHAPTHTHARACPYVYLYISYHR